MFITSARKPSAKTRTLCKLLSRFTGGRCINRGKMGMYELLEFVQGSPLIIIGEYHGNPGELNFYDENGKFLFSLRFSDWYSQEIDSFWFPDEIPSLAGKGETADALEFFFHFQRVVGDKIDQLPFHSTLIAVEDKYIDFIGDRKSLFRLNIKGFKKHGL